MLAYVTLFKKWLPERKVVFLHMCKQISNYNNSGLHIVTLVLFTISQQCYSNKAYCYYRNYTIRRDETLMHTRISLKQNQKKHFQ